MPAHRDPTTPWIRRLVAAPDSAVKLVCFPHAGGSASYFRGLALALAPRVETLAVQYPGRQERRREAPLESVSALADSAFEALRDVADEPFAFFGHSLGAVVAFETALRFEGRPGGPVRLFASAGCAPSVTRRPRLHLGDDDTLVAELSKLGGTDPAALALPQARAQFLPALRADYRAVGMYTAVPGARLTCPITVFLGDGDPIVSARDAVAWDDHTTKGTDTRTFEGGHFYLDDKAGEVAAEIIAAL